MEYEHEWSHINEYWIMCNFNRERKKPKDCKNPCASVENNCVFGDRHGDSHLEWSGQLFYMGMHGLASSSRNKGGGHC